jgi:P27 family predicted phage terminase small subunit
MAVRGRKPKPTHLKVLSGNPGRRPLPESEPKPQPVAPPCPDWLPEEARAKWDELAPELERLGLLTAVDGPAFAMTLLHYALAVEAAKRIDKEGITTVDERGLPRKHPLHQVLRDHSTSFRAYLAEFGLSPSSRVRLALPGQEDEGDEYEEFRRRGQAKGG